MHLDDPLSEKEFDELDNFLMSERAPDDCMTMDALHGYLSAIAIGPEMIAPAEWLPQVWGEGQAPTFKNDKEEKRILYLISRFMNEILTTLDVAPKEYEPLFCQIEEDGKTLVDGESWAWGFLLGMELRDEAWEEFALAEEGETLLRPIYLLGAEEIEEEETALVETAEQRHKLALEMEANFPLIRQFWAGKRKIGPAPIKRDPAKQGRNDPCACGSGKKYKQCHGAE